MKPKRRVRNHECPEWLGPAEYTFGECALCANHETICGDKCRIEARHLRRLVAEDPSSWAKDELRARGLKI